MGWIGLCSVITATHGTTPSAGQCRGGHWLDLHLAALALARAACRNHTGHTGTHRPPPRDDHCITPPLCSRPPLHTVCRVDAYTQTTSTHLHNPRLPRLSLARLSPPHTFTDSISLPHALASSDLVPSYPLLSDLRAAPRHPIHPLHPPAAGYPYHQFHPLHTPSLVPGYGSTRPSPAHTYPLVRSLPTLSDLRETHPDKPQLQRSKLMP